MTGDEEDKSAEFGDAVNHFRDLWPKINLEDISSFEKRYRGSDDEKCDIWSIVTKLNGDVTHLFHHVLIGDVDDWDRFMGIITEGFNGGEIEVDLKPMF
eukprot:GDKI01039542.1.p1 GENE.GDKI01039542.1~~GDKI01039542.1.p1  ORF type:complete len:109 (-),score=1.50 GDKI01039542.1:14-310(-)